MNTFYETYFCDRCNRFSKMEKQGGYFAPLFKPIENLLTNMFNRQCPKCGDGNIHKVTSKNVLKDTNWISSQSDIIDERLKTMKSNFAMVTIMSVIDIIAILSCAVLWWFPTFFDNASWWMWIIVVFVGYLFWGCLSYMSPNALLSICNYMTILICAYFWWFPSLFVNIPWWMWLVIIIVSVFILLILNTATPSVLCSIDITFILLLCLRFWWLPSFFGQLVWWGWILIVLGCGCLVALLSQANIRFLLLSNVFFISIAAVMAYYN